MLNSKCLSERITELFSDLSPDKMQFCLFMFAVYKAGRKRLVKCYPTCQSNDVAVSHSPCLRVSEVSVT